MALPRLATWVACAGIALAAQTALEGVSVKVDAKKDFDFKRVRTWDWNPRVTSEVKMARTQQDDPQAMQARVQPIITAAVVEAMTKRGLRQQSNAPDVVLTYYLLLTTTMTAQTLGQFLPATTMWGVPPFAPATQSLEVMNQGALVFDFSSGDSVVWRGVAQSKIKTDSDEARRTALLREAVRDLLKRFPPE